MTRGKYIVIEGADGTGKSTQVELLYQHLLSQGIKAIITQEPGGVAVAEKLRDIIKDGTLERDPWTNVMLLTTSRRTSWFQSIKPALAKGAWVIASRSYISTIAYQGYGEGIDVQKITDFTRDNVEPAYLSPDHLIILTLGDERTRKSRIGQRTSKHTLDNFESKTDNFQTAMQRGYVTYAEQHAIDPIDANQPIKVVAEQIWDTVSPMTA